MSTLIAELKKAEQRLQVGTRGSGKTYKMLQHALAAAKTGQTVFVIGHDDGQIRNLMNEMVRFTELVNLGPNVHVSYPARDIQLPHPMGRIQFRKKDHPDWDWDGLRMRGYPHGTPCYVDHYVYEKKLEEYTKAQKEAKK